LQNEKRTTPPTMADNSPITVREIEQAAREKLSKQVYEYYACGADDQNALRRNVEAYDR